MTLIFVITTVENMWLQSEGNDIKLYGTIWSGDGQFIASDLNSILKKYDQVNIHLHTPGGSVFDGNLIYNTLKNSKAKINIIVDGIAASMGSILLLAGDTVSIAENGFVMTHAPSGATQGTAQDFENTAKLLRSIEENFIEKYAAKTNQTPEQAKKMLQGDNWFSAKEAKSIGLVDEIIGIIIKDMSFTATASVNMNVGDLENIFKEIDSKRPDPSTVPTSEIVQTNKIDTDMKLNAKSLDVLGLNENSSDEQINAAIENMAKRNEDLQAKITADNQKRIDSLISSAKSAGKIVGENDEKDMRDLAGANFELAEKTIAKLPGKNSIVNQLDKTSSNPSASTERDNWTWADWSKKDTAGLLSMKQENPEKYKALLAQTGVKIN